ncbi:FkbM family methyltransferase [Algiphilus sp.]|uniref:FkbM family methyltransferase n=1 Tax=Algiphilus sp. TaxID=1872431 RepID=UPI003B519CD2
MTVFTAKARKLVDILAVPVWRGALRRQGVAAGVEHAGVLRNMGSVRTVVDIGANRGQFALVARHCFADARIVSFEPLSGPAARWRAVFASDVSATLVEAALGPQAGEAQVHVSGRDDSSSLLPIGVRQSVLFPGTEEVGIATVRVLRLADALQTVDIIAPALLKLDVQGFELQALAGCEEMLDHFDWVYAECSFQELYTGQSLADEVIAWLRERGLRLVGVYHMTYDARGQAVQADLLFGR